MAQPVIWLPAAVSDLDEVFDYIAHNSVNNAIAMYERLDATAASLAEMPGRGHRVQHADYRDFREVSVWPYRLIYRPDKDAIRIVAVWHGARGRLPNLSDRLTGDDAG